MTRDEVFDALSLAGIKVLRVHYYGGGDEGFVDTSDAIFVAESGWEDVSALLDNHNIDYEDLEAEVEAALGIGWYDGEPDVDGYVYWKVPEKKVTIKHSHTDWVNEDEREI